MCESIPWEEAATVTSVTFLDAPVFTADVEGCIVDVEVIVFTADASVFE